MTEIRPIRESEGEAFLTVLCDTFGLDFNLAYDLFFREPLFDLDRKWAMVEGQQLVSVLTTTPLEFGWGKAYGIAGVATRKDRQNEGLARRLIERVMRESARMGEEAGLLFAADTRLYQGLGFETLDRVVRGTVLSLPLELDSEPMPFAKLQHRYNEWSAGHPDRLRRDAQRWEYWQWNFREARVFRDGYYTLEQGVIRETLFDEAQKKLPVPRGTEWLGLSFVADELEIPLGTVSVPMYLMGHNVPGQPQLFMTDQF
jgi:predicted N-acetyltransferase YhbS